MSPLWADLVFGHGMVAGHVATIQGRPYGRHWLLYRGEPEPDLHRILALAEIDPTATGLGGAVQRHRLTLDVAADLSPVACTAESGYATTALRFAPALVFATLPDGTEHAIPRESASALASSTHVGLAALFHAACAAKGQDPYGDALLFVLETLTTVPSRHSVAPDLPAEQGTAWHRTSHGEEVLLDETGRLVTVRVPKIGYVLQTAHPPPDLPDWIEGAMPPPASARYAAPNDPSLRMEDLAIPGPVVPLGATLSAPNDDKPHPGLLLCAGSGTHDRHGIAGTIDIGTHEIMDGLAMRGFVGLRFDKRGAGTTALGRDALDRGLASECEDAAACLAALRARPETQGRGLAIIGHSLGGLVALALAVRGEIAVDAVVLMAAPGRRLDAISAEQIAAQGVVMGYSPEQTASQIADLREAVALIEAGGPWRPGDVPDHLLALFPTPTWLRDVLAFDAPALVARLRCPLLLCQGGADLQILPDADFAALRQAAAAAGIAHAARLYPALDHLFKPAEGSGSIAAYHERRNVDRRFIADLGDWLAKVLKVSG